jgi:hypothetical protein
VCDLCVTQCCFVVLSGAGLPLREQFHGGGSFYRVWAEANGIAFNGVAAVMVFFYRVYPEGGRHGAGDARFPESALRAHPRLVSRCDARRRPLAACAAIAT